MLGFVEKMLGYRVEDIMEDSRNLHNEEDRNMCTRLLLWCKTKEAKICDTCDIYTEQSKCTHSNFCREDLSETGKIRFFFYCGRILE